MKRRPSTLRQWVMLLFGATGIGLVPWTIWLAGTLRPTHESPRWDIAWSGFDGTLALLFLVTALAAWRSSLWVGVTARVVGSHLAAARESPPEGDLVGIFKVPADGEAAREARHPDTAA